MPHDKQLSTTDAALLGAGGLMTLPGAAAIEAELRGRRLDAMLRQLRDNGRIIPMSDYVKHRARSADIYSGLSSYDTSGSFNRYTTRLAKEKGITKLEAIKLALKDRAATLDGMDVPVTSSAAELGSRHPLYHNEVVVVDNKPSLIKGELQKRIAALDTGHYTREGVGGIDKDYEKLVKKHLKETYGTKSVPKAILKRIKAGELWSTILGELQAFPQDNPKVVHPLGAETIKPFVNDLGMKPGIRDSLALISRQEGLSESEAEKVIKRMLHSSSRYYDGKGAVKAGIKALLLPSIFDSAKKAPKLCESGFCSQGVSNAFKLRNNGGMGGMPSAVLDNPKIKGEYILFNKLGEGTKTGYRSAKEAGKALERILRAGANKRRLISGAVLGTAGLLGAGTGAITKLITSGTDNDDKVGYTESALSALKNIISPDKTPGVIDAAVEDASHSLPSIKDLNL